MNQRFSAPPDVEAHAVRLKKGSKAGQDGVTRILVGLSTCGIASGADSTFAALQRGIEQRRMTDIELARTGCVGLCHSEPTVEVRRPGLPAATLGEVTEEKAAALLDALAGQGELPGLLCEDGTVYNKQVRVALRNCGRIDPESFDDYVRAGGYRVLARVLAEETPEEIIRVLKESGLRGRGGGGFPTGLKWEFAHKSPGEPKYVVCNADEGDPGAFMDRSVLEGDPHVIVEAMTLAGYAIGASRGFVYVRAEYPLAVRRLSMAIDQARQAGLLGDDILGTGFCFDMKIKYGAGAFVCGEETSLIHSIEGGRGEPTVKPPFPAESGLWGQPTNVNNVETLANIVPILEKGSAWFRGIGTEKSPGTKVFALAGDVRNVGLVEVPMGTTLRTIVEDIGGGTPDGKPVKAVQTGGPSGGCIPAAQFDTPVDYDSLADLGSIMGSGGMIVMDADASMVEVARFYLQFTCDESCGKCTPCRIGTKRLLEILDRLLAHDAAPDDLQKLEELGEVIRDTALCGLGQTAPNPVLSTLNWFPEEYQACLEPKRDVTIYRILEDVCVGCRACARACPVGCIDGEVKKPHVIDQERCVHCGACYSTCKFDAIVCE